MAMEIGSKLRRWFCIVFGHDLHWSDTKVKDGVYRTKCRRCNFVIQTPET